MRFSKKSNSMLRAERQKQILEILREDLKIQEEVRTEFREMGLEVVPA